jgi:hypothetical protein
MYYYILGIILIFFILIVIFIKPQNNKENYEQTNIPVEDLNNKSFQSIFDPMIGIKENIIREFNTTLQSDKSNNELYYKDNPTYYTFV